MPEVLTIERVLVPIGFLGGLVCGVTGFGSALVTIRLATYFVPLPCALSVFVPAALLGIVLSSRRVRRIARELLLKLVALLLLATGASLIARALNQGGRTISAACAVRRSTA